MILNRNLYLRTIVLTTEHPRRCAAPPLTTSNLRFQRGKPSGRMRWDL